MDHLEITDYGNFKLYNSNSNVLYVACNRFTMQIDCRLLKLLYQILCLLCVFFIFVHMIFLYIFIYVYKAYHNILCKYFVLNFLYNLNCLRWRFV